MNYLVWILRHGRLSPQAWSERSFSIHKDGGPRIVARHEIAEEHRDWPLDILRDVYPAPVEVVT